MDYKKEIDKIITEGIKNNWDEKIIVDKILALTTQERKTNRISVADYEKLLREGKNKIREAQKILISSLSGSRQ
ncbi:MAG: hypothetical protein WBW71_10800 [Bacteroidota bacterium]